MGRYLRFPGRIIGEPGALATGEIARHLRATLNDGWRLTWSLTLPARLSTLSLHWVVLCFGVWIAFAPTIRYGHLQTDPGDTLLNHYILEHSWKWLSDSDYTFFYWSPPCFYPAEQTLAYSENLLGTAPIYWLARIVTSELPAYQIWMIAVTGLTYVAMAWTLRRFGVTHLLVALGAACFAFGLPRINQLCHQQMLPAMFSPLAVYSLWRFVEGPTVGRLALVTFFVVLQLLSSIYLGWFLCVSLAVFAVIAYSFRRSSRRLVVQFILDQYLSVALVVIVAATALVPMFLPYILANSGFHRSYRHEVALMLPSLASWLSPPPASSWANLLPPNQGPLAHEHHLFPGAVFILLSSAAGVIWIARRRLPPLAWVCLATGAILMSISLRFGKVSAWHLVHSYVPGAQGIRAVTRIFSVVLLFGWIGSLIAVSDWLRGRRFATMAGAVLLMWGLGEQYQPRLPAFDARPFFAETDRLASELRGANAAYVELDPASPYWTGQLAAMWAGLKANVPVVNGYSGRTPNGYPDEKMNHDAESLSKWLNGREVRIIAAPRLVEETRCRIMPTKPWEPVATAPAAH
jgi:hypothetical protein